jgi:hypothetical protein
VKQNANLDQMIWSVAERHFIGASTEGLGLSARPC